jgi:hypothetical protein
MQLEFKRLPGARLTAFYRGNVFVVWRDRLDHAGLGARWLVEVNGEIVSSFASEFAARRAADRYANGFSYRAGEEHGGIPAE